MGSFQLAFFHSELRHLDMYPSHPVKWSTRTYVGHCWLSWSLWLPLLLPSLSWWVTVVEIECQPTNKLVISLFVPFDLISILYDFKILPTEVIFQRLQRLTILFESDIWNQAVLIHSSQMEANPETPCSYFREKKIKLVDNLGLSFFTGSQDSWALSLNLLFKRTVRWLLISCGSIWVHIKRWDIWIIF